MRQEHSFILAAVVLAFVAYQIPDANAHGCQGHGFMCHEMPNGTFWSYADTIAFALMLSLTLIVAALALRYRYLRRTELTA